MKITFVMPGLNMRGGTRVVSIYADILKKRGHDVKVVTIRRILSWKDRLKFLLQGKGFRRVKASFPSYFDDLDIEVIHVEGYKPNPRHLPDSDVVIATWWETANTVAELPKQKGAKAYFIQHYEIHDYMPIDQVKATYRLPFHKIVIAQWLGDLMAETFEDPHFSLVPNSVDLDLFAAPNRGKQPQPTVGFMLSQVVWKGCDLILKAYKLAQKYRPDLQLIAFGPDLAEIDLPLPEGLKYTVKPEQSELKKIYSACDGWLFGSTTEGFGLPILEAMACRTPVIGTPAGAAPELLSEGCGFLVKQGDPEDMAQAILKICAMSDEEWRQMSDRAYAKAASYTWEDATDRFEAALNLAIARQTKQQVG